VSVVAIGRIVFAAFGNSVGLTAGFAPQNGAKSAVCAR
jgi:hypothetical protein